MEEKDSSLSASATETPTIQGWLTAFKARLSDRGTFTEFLEDFKTCKTDTERVDKLYKLPETHDVVKVKVVRQEKNEEESARLREKGNEMFKKRQYQKALELYNTSVAMAPTSGETTTLSLALANRSAVLCHIKLYKPCLDDIEAAIQYGYPENLRHKLYERRGKCHYHLMNEAEAKEAFSTAKTLLHRSGLEETKMKNLINDYDKQIWQCEKMAEDLVKKAEGTIQLHSPVPNLEGKVNPKIPCASDAVDVGYTDQSGRGLFAQQDIQVGKVLVIEKPFASTVLSDFRHRYCHHCCTRVIAPAPCLSCSYVVFCGIKCQQEAQESYHKYECDVLSSAHAAEINLGHLALKTVIKAGYETLVSFEEKSDTDKTQVYFNENGEYDSQDYRTVYDLVNHSEMRKVGQLLKYTLEAIYLLKCLENTSFFGNSSGDDGVFHKCVVGGHILRNLMMLPCNAHECSELLHVPSNLPGSLTAEIGSAIYPVLSLINHSCDPNVVRHSYGNICVVRAIRNIPKGSELLDNYGALCALEPTEVRRKKLVHQYFFTCNCQACIDDYPQYTDIPSDTPVFKCDSCSGPVFMPIDNKYDMVPCSFCQHIHALTPRLSTLAESDETYRMAMKDVLLSSCDNIDQNIIFLEEHLALMDRLLCRPWRDFNDCQEALKQCYAYKASHFTVNTKH